LPTALCLSRTAWDGGHSAVAMQISSTNRSRVQNLDAACTYLYDRAICKQEGVCMVRNQPLGSFKASGSAESQSAPAKRSIWRRIWLNRSLYLLLTPVLAGMALFQYYPTLVAAYRSFFVWDGLHAHYIGLENFRFFFEDRQMAK